MRKMRNGNEEVYTAKTKFLFQESILSKQKFIFQTDRNVLL